MNINIPEQINEYTEQLQNQFLFTKAEMDEIRLITHVPAFIKILSLSLLDGERQQILSMIGSRLYTAYLLWTTSEFNDDILRATVQHKFQDLLCAMPVTWYSSDYPSVFCTRISDYTSENLIVDISFRLPMNLLSYSIRLSHGSVEPIVVPLPEDY
jgi:hypothetical protein